MSPSLNHSLASGNQKAVKGFECQVNDLGQLHSLSWSDRQAQTHFNTGCSKFATVAAGHHHLVVGRSDASHVILSITDLVGESEFVNGLQVLAVTTIFFC